MASSRLLLSTAPSGSRSNDAFFFFSMTVYGLLFWQPPQPVSNIRGASMCSFVQFRCFSEAQLLAFLPSQWSGPPQTPPPLFLQGSVRPAPLALFSSLIRFISPFFQPGPPLRRNPPSFWCRAPGRLMRFSFSTKLLFDFPF